MTTPIDPLFSSRWPRCNNTIDGIGDIALICTLLMHHERDGQFEHEDDDGARWWMTAPPWVIDDAL